MELRSRTLPHESDPGPDDAELLTRLRAGDEAAYEIMVRRHSPHLFAVAKRFMKHDEDACDVLQDAFLSAFKSLHKFEGGSKLSTWLHRITVNAALMKIRSRSRRPERAIEDLLPTYESDGHRANIVPAWEPPEETDPEREETRRLVQSKIDELPEDYRTVLLLRDIEELDTESTAHALQISVAAVKTRLHRARQALRTLLEEELA